MKNISIREARSISFGIMEQAEKRREEYFEKEAKVVTMEEDVQEELLVLCRGHAAYLCDETNFTVTDWGYDGVNVTGWDTNWVEAGDQVYAMWRGWV